MAISFYLHDVDFLLEDEAKIKQWISLVIHNHHKEVGVISYLFCNDEYILQNNQSFLNHDTYTDIITFDYVEGDIISGDIMISIDRVKENASTFAVPFSYELRRVIIHGILHLLGQGDKTDSEALQMRKREDDALALWDTIV